MPILGFGVYQNYTTKESVLEAFRAGYRYAPDHLREAKTTNNLRKPSRLGASLQERSSRRRSVQRVWAGEERRVHK